MHTFSPFVRTIVLTILMFGSASAVGQPLRILFVGNSLTYTNDIPALVREIGKMDGIRIQTAELLLPDYSLEDHWNEGKVQRQLATGNYDVVVAQQGPSALPESRVLLEAYAQKFAEACKDKNVKFALYMVWPSKARSFDHPGVIRSYSGAAKKTGAILCPVGTAWAEVWEKDPAFPLYSADQFHPSLEGSVLAAMTIYGALQEKKNFDFIGKRRASWSEQISPTQMELMTNASLEAIGKP